MGRWILSSGMEVLQSDSAEDRKRLERSWYPQSHPHDEDSFAETVAQATCLEMLKAIREHMRATEDVENNIEWLPFPTTISPFVGKELANSYGFTMELDLKAIDIV